MPLFVEQPRNSESMGGPTDRGQYSREDAKIYFKAAREFPRVKVRIIAKAGEKMLVYGGSVIIQEGCVGLEIEGRSDFNSENKLGSFYALVKELQAFRADF